jgi:hypothetical protein
VSLQAADGSIRYSRTSAQTPVWVTAQALDGLEGKPFPLPPAPRKKARSVTVAATASTPETTATTTPRIAPPPAKRRAEPTRTAPVHTAAMATSTRAHGARQPKANDPQLQVKPVAQTTTSERQTPSNDDGPDSYWPYIFAVLLGAAILAGLRLAWRRE